MKKHTRCTKIYLKKSKKLYFQNKLNKCENNIKNTWKIMKNLSFKKLQYKITLFPKI